MLYEYYDYHSSCIYVIRRSHVGYANIIFEQTFMYYLIYLYHYKFGT